MHVASPAPPDPPAADRPAVAGGELRRRIVRGTVINAVALAAIDLLVLAQGLIVTRLLGPAAIGLYGIVTVTTMTVVALKRVGVDEAFVAQDEPEQALEFQRAFTLELAISAVFALVLCALAPVVAAVYGDSRLLALMAATAYLPLAFALQAPTWIFFRRMDFACQRLLQGVVPVVTFVVTVPLAATFARYVDRADQIVTVTIYPAICAIRGRTAALAELFVRSNRATLLWTLPAAAGIVLIGPALVDHVLGRAWEDAIVLVQGLAVAAA